MDNITHGNKAVSSAVQKYGNSITPAMVGLIKEEGFANNVYKDHKGNETSEVGQTGIYLNMPFPEVYARKEDELRSMLPDYDMLPADFQEALMSSHYRGTLRGSPTALKLIKQGNYKEAAAEYLDNDEYREAVEKRLGTAGRFEREAAAILKAGKDLQQ
tara:strand:+ start:52 stop:528 length:477 start_codon:yes stop_codon:yes gene_type:complete